MRHLRLFVCAVPLVLFGVGCDEKLSDLTGPTPNLQPTLSSIASQIFTATDSSGRRACNACHTDVGRTPAAGLNLKDAATAYASLVGRPSTRKPGATFVVAGDPANSYLMHKLEGRSDITGVRMPIGGPPYLTDGQLLVVRRWIESGAKND
jgi:hypothetical protein